MTGGSDHQWAAGFGIGTNLLYENGQRIDHGSELGRLHVVLFNYIGVWNGRGRAESHAQLAEVTGSTLDPLAPLTH